MDAAHFASTLSHLHQRIVSAATRSGRKPTDIHLLAVSKTHPPETIRNAWHAGQHSFAENYAQELRDKAPLLADLGIEWHFIGPLQRNKAKYVAPVCSWIHSISSIETAMELAQRATRPINCLVQVNISGEISKSGTTAAAALELCQHLLTLAPLNLVGLMCLPPFDPDPEQSRPYFQQMCRLRDELNLQLDSCPLQHLSMGMSHDFEVAIEEGATIVRIGTALFGERS